MQCLLHGVPPESSSACPCCLQSSNLISTLKTENSSLKSHDTTSHCEINWLRSLLHQPPLPLPLHQTNQNQLSQTIHQTTQGILTLPQEIIDKILTCLTSSSIPILPFCHAIPHLRHISQTILTIHNSTDPPTPYSKIWPVYKMPTTLLHTATGTLECTASTIPPTNLYTTALLATLLTRYKGATSIIPMPTKTLLEITPYLPETVHIEIPHTFHETGRACLNVMYMLLELSELNKKVSVLEWPCPHALDEEFEGMGYTGGEGDEKAFLERIAYALRRVDVREVRHEGLPCSLVYLVPELRFLVHLVICCQYTSSYGSDVWWFPFGLLTGMRQLRGLGVTAFSREARDLIYKVLPETGLTRVEVLSFSVFEYRQEYIHECVREDVWLEVGFQKVFEVGTENCAESREDVGHLHVKTCYPHVFIRI
ncbi:hypothetical protein BCR33DRAFT_508755 [Rhizoclosmatium globosum]|uniref:F-box domain-containing protein n=1 Tax=Rhizoclosmatium globosum TaxID=329046 RepID=A0A1Y2BI46_9FUNG|nr:hypothetical protein BCR33DRAFT_508755 [Rhizoclosmatium globosum]|eukprot:ORY34464.1 hypothetical protein BCR33DRAFT_508755 [Rhizoclosmatium globosum]